MRPTENEFKRAVQTISAMKYFPITDPGVKTEVLDLLGHMVDTAENLEWLRVTCRDKVREWPGLAEIRAIYCTSHRPADGIETVSAIPGFRGEDLEAQYQRELGEAQTRQLADWGVQKKLLESPRRASGLTQPRHAAASGRGREEKHE